MNLRVYLIYTVLSSTFSTGHSAVNGVIKLGLIYAGNQATHTNILNGYHFYAHKINSQGGLVVGQPGNQSKYNISIIAHSNSDPQDPYWVLSGSSIGYNSTNSRWIWTNGNEGYPSEQDRNFWQQKRLYNTDYINFQLGGSTTVPANETYTAALNNVIDMVCCVGPDQIYQQNFAHPNIFGIQCSNVVYTQQTILSLNLLGARTIAITYVYDILFTSTTCLAAIDYATNQAKVPYKIVFQYQYPDIWENTVNQNQDPVYDPISGKSFNLTQALIGLAEAKPDVWIHCGYAKSGVFGLKLLNKLGFRPKATLQTVAPNTISSYMQALGHLGMYVLAVGQWHPAMTYKDNFFGSGPHFSAEFFNFTGVDAEYVAAGAAVTSYVLGAAIQQYYSTQPHITGVFNTPGIVSILRQTRTETFFGNVQFNAYNRNIAKDPATMQNQPDSTQPYGVNQRCVYPESFGNGVIIYPDPLSIPPTPSPVIPQPEIENNLNIVIGVVVAAVCLIVVVLLLSSFYCKDNDYKELVDSAHNFPVHKAILTEKKADSIDKVFAAHKDAVIEMMPYQEREYSALDIVLMDRVFSKKAITERLVFEIAVVIFDTHFLNTDLESTRKMREAIKNKNSFTFVKLAQTPVKKAADVMKQLLEKYSTHAKLISNFKDEYGRNIVDVSTPEIRLEIQKRIWLFGCFEIHPGRPAHISQSSMVLFAKYHDITKLYAQIHPNQSNDQGGSRRNSNASNLPIFEKNETEKTVVLKFMRYKSQLNDEVKNRENFPPAAYADPGYVVQLLDRFGESNEERDILFRREAIRHGMDNYPYCLVLEAGDLALKRVIEDQNVVGAWDDIRKFVTELSKALTFLHRDAHLIHADLKPSNILTSSKFDELKLIDFDASVKIDEPVGKKYSSAIVPPEMIFFDGKKYQVKSLTIDHATTEATKKDNYEPVIASESFDMWSFGTILYYMSTGRTLFSADKHDNIYDQKDLKKLYEWTDESLDDVLHGIKDRNAKNLLSLLLCKDPESRLTTEKVLEHPFCTNKVVSRLSNESAEFDVFISYRVASDSRLAEELYAELTTAQLKVWFDKQCLEPGKKWEDGFCDGLLKSKAFLCILSGEGVKNFNHIDENSACDNVLLEWQLALELVERHYITHVYPVLVGPHSLTVDPDTGREFIEYKSYFDSGCNPRAPKVIVKSVEEKYLSHLRRQGLGTPYKDILTVAGTFDELLHNQGCVMTGEHTVMLAKIVLDVQNMTKSRCNRNSTSSIDSSSGVLEDVMSLNTDRALYPAKSYRLTSSVLSALEAQSDDGCDYEFNDSGETKQFVEHVRENEDFTPSHFNVSVSGDGVRDTFTHKAILSTTTTVLGRTIKDPNENEFGIIGELV